MNVGGFKPTENPQESWFGKVNYCSENEEWPYSNNLPMLPLAQINLESLNFKPERLKNLAFTTIFIDAVKLPLDMENCAGWQIRTYSSLNELVK